MDMPFLFTIVCSVGGAVWFLSQQLAEINRSIDSIGDALKEYQIINDNVVSKQKDRITSLKVHAQQAINDLHHRVLDIENVLSQTPVVQYHKRHKSTMDIETKGDFSNEEWTEIK